MGTVKARALRLLTPTKAEGEPVLSPDASALARVADGDIAALGEVFDRHSSAVLRYVARVAGSTDADDVVQATFIRVAKLAPTFDRRAESARPWLIGIASRIVLERRRGFARLTRAVVSLTQAPPARVSFEPSRSDLQRGLDRLTPAKRIVLILAEVEEYTCDEISLMLDIPIGTVWTRLHHARRELRAHIEEGA